jgi:hypothetical protein
MTRKSLLVGVGIAAGLAGAILASAAPAEAQPYGGWGARGNLRADCPIYRAYGPGYMRTARTYGGGPVRGWRGSGYGPGYGWRRGPGYGPGCCPRW